MSLPALQPELRALELFEVVPAGCFAILVTGDEFEPHLRRGEFAIVDSNDKERTFGELYVLTMGDAKQRLAIVELIKGFANGGNVCPVGIWFAFSLSRHVDVGGGLRCRMVDGPLRFENWPDKCRGRIVGVMVAR